MGSHNDEMICIVCIELGVWEEKNGPGKQHIDFFFDLFGLGFVVGKLLVVKPRCDEL